MNPFHSEGISNSAIRSLKTSGRFLRNTVLPLACAFGLMAATGCGTMGKYSEYHKPMIYGGAGVDAALLGGGIAEPGGWPAGWGLALIGLIDLPLSLAADTIMLPYDIYAQTKEYPVYHSCGINVNSTKGFTGHFVYIEKGQEKQRSLGDGRIGGLSTGTSGVLKNCAVTNSSERGAWVEVKIEQDNKIVFTSGRRTNREPIVYEAPSEIPAPPPHARKAK
jgi:uncharacterized protein YceK